MTIIELANSAEEGVGDRIRLFRRERGLTQEELGLAIGASTPQSAKATVAKIEKGQIPGGLRLQRIAEALKCSADILLSGTSRELFEVIRYSVRPRGRLEGPPYSAFRVARIFLHFALVSGECTPESEFVETANRLFYLAERDPDVCRRLFALLPRGNPSQLVANGNLRSLIRSAMQQNGVDPSAYRGYSFAVDAIELVRQHYIPPGRPDLPASGDDAEAAGTAPGSTLVAALEMRLLDYAAGVPQEGGAKALPAGSAVVRIEGDSLEPLARHGQFAMVAGPDRLPREGDLVACWTRRRGLLFRRYVASSSESHTLFSVAPTAYEPLRLEANELVAMRVILGVLFE